MSITFTSMKIVSEYVLLLIESFVQFVAKDYTASTPLKYKCQSKISFIFSLI